MVNPLGDAMAIFNCHGPEDCTEGGAGQACCFDIMTMTASCAPAPCAMYTQCMTSNDCPGGGICTPSPLSATEHYCVGGGVGSADGGGAEGSAAETGAAEAGGAETGASDSGAD
jgi:hypothetical protein